ncbi:arsenical pump-driving ATPase [Dongia sp.]|uniref:arsenical pump-driving ATPase n=1 Tax=Dongia sp. TaxID=1977262 RepID=UPI0035B17ED4
MGDTDMAVLPLGILTRPTRFIFFTGKGGVGKTALSCGIAIALADSGKRVLLISTDPASNLDEMLGVRLDRLAKAVPNVDRLFALNIDPEASAEAYRRRVIGAMGPADETEIAKVREQLSGACTTEIAAFDEFAELLSGEHEEGKKYDHIIFDTAPTGHTLRLLSLPKAWSSFLETNERGASCLGPHSGLQMQLAVFERALKSLTDPSTTTVALVTRPEPSALREAARSAEELLALGLGNQRLIVNATFRAADPSDSVASAMERRCQSALAKMPVSLTGLPRDEIPMRAYDMVGLVALRRFLSVDQEKSTPSASQSADGYPDLGAMVAEIEAAGNGVVMVMGKGGVGKTTVAAAIAVELASRGHQVLLTTTDPAAHVSWALASDTMPTLKVERIDPAVETERYIDRIMAGRGAELDDAEKALLLEDLRSPCTEEVAVFHAFSRVVLGARDGFVIIDTAPTGHTFLLLDATGAYHRQVLRDSQQIGQSGRLVTPLMRLQDPAYTKILLVALPETTPISEASALQDDLRRAGIEPYGWVINNCLGPTGTHDPLLQFRIGSEAKQINRVRDGLAKRLAVITWQQEPPTGIKALRHLIT